MEDRERKTQIEKQTQRHRVRRRETHRERERDKQTERHRKNDPDRQGRFVPSAKRYDQDISWPPLTLREGVCLS